MQVSGTTPFPGPDPEAAAFLDSFEDMVPVLDGEGRLREVPRGPALDVLLERARLRGWRVQVVTVADRKTVRVAP